MQLFPSIFECVRQPKAGRFLIWLSTAFHTYTSTATTQTRRSLRRDSMLRSRGWQRATLAQSTRNPTPGQHTRMSQRSWIDTGFILANWEIRPRHGTLLRRDHSPADPVRIEPRVMAVLTCLAHHVGEVVSRDELCAEVWGGRVVSDEALSRCISLLRHVLDDNLREPRFIRTIARIGYTLVPIPEPLAPDAGEVSSPQAIFALPATQSVAAAIPPPPDVYRFTRLWNT